MNDLHHTPENDRLRQALRLALEEEITDFQEEIHQNGPHAFPDDFPDRILNQSPKAARKPLSLQALSGGLAAAVLLLFLIGSPLRKQFLLNRETALPQEAAFEEESAVVDESSPQVPFPDEEVLCEASSLEEALEDASAVSGSAIASVSFDNGTLCLSLTAPLPVPAQTHLTLVTEAEVLLSETDYTGADRLLFPLQEAPDPGTYKILQADEILCTFTWDGMQNP